MPSPVRSRSTTFRLCKSRSTLSEGSLPRRSDQSALTTWAPAVDIYETENELVLKADLSDVNEKDLDIRIENNILTISGERKFEQQTKEENYLRIERNIWIFNRRLQPAKHCKYGAIKAHYKNGV